ncbi:class I SAM-dependent methyltransferase [Massilia sp. TWR1-2-2]|uniref:class I SAM-dependent methyltransferase n=1 Tax=Massilia sp. TWR1-2-2 TaxID=2804584 RepID=UPI003CE6ECAE
MRTLSLAEYLAWLRMPPEHAATEVACEVCNEAESVLIRASVEIEHGLDVDLRVLACARCGYLFQNPRFDAAFYSAYYEHRYRLVLSGSAGPSDGFMQDQRSRGEYLYRRLAGLFDAPGRMLDVGCSAGGVMHAFLMRGWTGFGTDPDAGYVAHGQQHYQAPIALQAAEEMVLEPHSYDLIVITGSLEHVVDPNRVLALCRLAARPGAVLLLEGRALAQARQTGRCGHNHRRYLTAKSINLLMRKHAWQPLSISDEPLCGPTRPHSVFGIGRAGDPLGSANFDALVRESAGDGADETRGDFARWLIR